MRNGEIRKMFDEHIDSRLANPQWSSEIARSVIMRARRERKNKAADVAAFLFPVAAAALLIWAVFPFLAVDQDADVHSAFHSTDAQGQSSINTAYMTADVDGIAGYFPEY